MYKYFEHFYLSIDFLYFKHLWWPQPNSKQTERKPFLTVNYFLLFMYIFF